MKREGFTIIELIISLAIFSLVIPIIYEVSQEVISSTTTMAAVNETKLINQMLISDIKAEVIQSALIFDNSSSYKDKIILSLPSNFTPLDSSRLPIIDETSKLPPNPDKVGNIIFTAKYLKPIESTVNNTTYRLDSYRFLYYFLAKDTSVTINRRSPIVLLKAKSREVYVDYVGISNISDNNARKGLVEALYSMGIGYAVDLKRAKFYKLSQNGNISPVDNHLIEMDTTLASKDFGFKTLPTGNVYYAIGYNGSIGTPKFAIPSDMGDSFPNGFEVAIVGPRSSRDILVRIVVTANFSAKTLGNENISIISVPQF